MEESLDLVFEKLRELLPSSFCIKREEWLHGYHYLKNAEIVERERKKEWEFFYYRGPGGIDHVQLRASSLEELLQKVCVWLKKEWEAGKLGRRTYGKKIKVDIFCLMLSEAQRGEKV